MRAEHWIAALDLHSLSFPLPFSSICLAPCRANCCFAFIHLFSRAVGCKYCLFHYKTQFVNTQFVFLIKRITQQVRKHTKQRYVSRAEASMMGCANSQVLSPNALRDCIEPQDSDTIHLSRFSFNYRSPMGTSGVVKQRNQHYSNYWLAMK